MLLIYKQSQCQAFFFEWDFEGINDIINDVTDNINDIINDIRQTVTSCQCCLNSLIADCCKVTPSAIFWYSSNLECEYTYEIVDKNYYFFKYQLQLIRYHTTTTDRYSRTSHFFIYYIV